MTDQIPADVTPEDMEHARAYVQDLLGATYAPDRILAVARVLQALLPSPPRPTLADMTSEERAACRRMQADIVGGDEPLVITRINQGDGTALILDRNGRVDEVPAGAVTPRPDLPRFEWPGDTSEPALPEGWRPANHPRYGRVLVTTPEPDDEGDLWFIDPSAEPGSMEHWCDSDVLTFLDTDEEGDTNE